MHLFTTATSTDERTRAATIAVLPVGSFEQHSDFLPLATDSIVANLIAQRIAADHNLFLLPPVTISCSHEHEGFPGTVSIRAATLIAVINDIRVCLRRTGTHRLVLVNGHGGNYVLSNITQEANVDGPRVALFPGRTDWATARHHARLTTTVHEDMHAGELETSLLLHAHPDLVGPGYRSGDHDASDRPHLLATGMRGYTTTGVIGRPSLATADKGKALLDSLTASFADHLEILIQGSP